jgi:hypothetical protein
MRRLAAILVGGAVAGGLGGCAGDAMLDIGLPGYAMGHEGPVSPDTPVRPMVATGKPWPNLASVPDRPTDVPPLAERRGDMERLARDRDIARATARQIEESLPQPLPVPQPPALTPRVSPAR